MLYGVKKSPFIDVLLALFIDWQWGVWWSPVSRTSLQSGLRPGLPETVEEEHSQHRFNTRLSGKSWNKKTDLHHAIFLYTVCSIRNRICAEWEKHMLRSNKNSLSLFHASFLPISSIFSRPPPLILYLILFCHFSELPLFDSPTSHSEQDPQALMGVARVCGARPRECGCSQGAAAVRPQRDGYWGPCGHRKQWRWWQVGHIKNCHMHEYLWCMNPFVTNSFYLFPFVPR